MLRPRHARKCLTARLLDSQLQLPPPTPLPPLLFLHILPVLLLPTKTTLVGCTYGPVGISHRSYSTIPFLSFPASELGSAA
jgi:hypothetical protein